MPLVIFYHLPDNSLGSEMEFHIRLCRVLNGNFGAEAAEKSLGQPLTVNHHVAITAPSGRATPNVSLLDYVLTQGCSYTTCRTKAFQ